MNAAQRRERILTRLNSAGAPLSASTLAAELGVSRQIVVGDVALLRAGVLKCGADKVSVNSGALKDPGLIPAAAQRYGDQCVVLSADVKRVNGQFRVFAKGGREDTGRDALDWISWCAAHGAGEICLNSIDTDGVRNGFDLEMLDAVAARVNIPIIASGGAGKKEDFLELFHHKGIDAGLAAGIFHQKLLSIRELKEYLNANGVEMRL